MGNTTNTTGQITTFGVDANLAGLNDGTDKMHSGILKALFAASTGNYVYSLDSNGISQGSGSTYTRFTVDNDIVFYRNGERFVITGTNLYTDIDTVPHSTHDRYDLLVIIANNTLDIRTGTAAATPLVSVLTDGDVPIALIRVVAGTGNQITTRPIQMYTAADSEKAISHTSSSGHGIIQNVTPDKDIIFKGDDGGSTITALTLDMSEAGAAAFNSTVTATGFTIGSAAINETELEILDGATLTTTELNYVDGVTSAIQTQLDTKIGTSSSLDIRGPAGTGAASGGALTLSTAELTVVDGDYLGIINFQAPLETGADAILVGASIHAEADVTFDATNNATELVFSTASTSAAIERMRIDQAGTVIMQGDLETTTTIRTSTLFQSGVLITASAPGPAGFLALSRGIHIVSAPALPGGGPLVLQGLEGTSENVGKQHKIIVTSVAGAPAIVTLDWTMSSQVLVDTTYGTIGGTGSAYTLAAGKVYDLVCVALNHWMLILLN